MEIWIEGTEYGKKNLMVKQDEKSRPVYSRYDPGRDGERFYKEHFDEVCDFYIFIGLGLGYHIEPFISVQALKKLIILEPVEKLFLRVKDEENIKKIMESGKVELYGGVEARRFVKELKGHYEYLLYKKIVVLSYSPLQRIFPVIYNRLEREVKNQLDILISDGLTIARFARIWLRNFTINIKKLNKTLLVSSLFNRFSGTVVIAGAGPSLDGAIDDIKIARKRIYLFATDAAVKPLMHNGVIPDLIISIDPQPSVYLHFQGLNRRSLAEIPAVLSFLSFSKVFEIFRERYVFFTYHPTTRFFSLDRDKSDVIINYLSVSSFAFHIAVSMGFTELLLVGLDFSYPEYRLYARNSFFYEYVFEHCSRFSPFYTIEENVIRRGTGKIESIRGEILNTSATLMNYLHELENIIQDTKNNSHRSFLFSGKGARIKGAHYLRYIAGESRRESIKGTPSAREGRISLQAGNEPKSDDLVDLTLTLALRERIYKNIIDPEEAVERARDYIKMKYSQIKFQ